MEERRRYIRIDLCTEVEYEILPMGGVSLVAQSRNISEGGMCFLANRELKVSSILRLKFYFPDEQRSCIECLGRVVWQRETEDGFLTGVEFREIDVDKQIKIGTFVLKFLQELKEYTKSC